MKSQLQEALNQIQSGGKDGVKNASAILKNLIDNPLTTLYSTEAIQDDVDPDAPFKVGDWVSRFGEDRPLFGKVKNVYKDFMRKDEKAYLIDLVVYHPSGQRKGRVSPAMGGPKGFEPALDADGFKKIERPDMPMFLTDSGNNYNPYEHLLFRKSECTV